MITLSRDLLVGIIIGGVPLFVLGAVIGYASGLRDALRKDRPRD